MLDLNVFKTFAIEKPPLRSNISYHFLYLSKENTLENIFHHLINDLKMKREKTERCIIFCQTRKQCSIVYSLFSVLLGEDIFSEHSTSQKDALVHMFHAGSPQSVKDHVVHEMSIMNSHLRVLVCTIAFGMGIDCKAVHQSIHFGPSKTVEGLVQETGRLGRDGKQCFCYVLFNGLLTAHCDPQMKELVQLKSCRRTFISKLFGSNCSKAQPEGGCCCDVCYKPDEKGSCSLQMMEFKLKDNSTSVEHKSGHIKRCVSNAQRAMLEKQLINYRAMLLPSNTDQFIPVGSSGILLEFGNYHINQVLQHCDHLFTMDDIITCIELWRNSHAKNIFLALNEVFRDMEESCLSSLTAEEDFENMDIVEEDWQNIRDDDSRAELFTDSKFSDLSKLTTEDSRDESQDFEIANASAIIEDAMLIP
eukprot:Seg199.13 transcript_id=Seg199.13/GoldUCD/mRNA.D3Y31 product="putative ATP-dependent RNA helicase R290" protein_id=Seg199.13/GoldUCD/D3Y31